MEMQKRFLSWLPILIILSLDEQPLSLQGLLFSKCVEVRRGWVSMTKALCDGSTWRHICFCEGNNACKHEKHTCEPDGPYDAGFRRGYLLQANG